MVEVQTTRKARKIIIWRNKPKLSLLLCSFPPNVVLVRAGRLAGADLAGTCYLLEAKKNPKDRDWYKDEDEDKLEDAKADEEADENQYIFACN